MYYDIQDTAAATEAVQKFLLEIAYAEDWLPFVSIDGVYGPATRRAVLTFQKRYGLSPTGTVDRSTLFLLHSKYRTARQKNEALSRGTV
jgi:peptidoglycan hydrolase-like protein with peptidoglycan-binding domain